jgi:hypothetical protein
MPADLKAPFKESCCDGGECNIGSQSAQSCGCDPGIDWKCDRHKYEAKIEELEERILELEDKLYRSTYESARNTS